MWDLTNGRNDNFANGSWFVLWRKFSPCRWPWSSNETSLLEFAQGGHGDPIDKSKLCHHGRPLVGTRSIDQVQIYMQELYKDPKLLTFAVYYLSSGHGSLTKAEAKTDGSEHLYNKQSCWSVAMFGAIDGSISSVFVSSWFHLWQWIFVEV